MSRTVNEQFFNCILHLPDVEQGIFRQVLLNASKHRISNEGIFHLDKQFHGSVGIPAYEAAMNDIHKIHQNLAIPKTCCLCNQQEGTCAVGDDTRMVCEPCVNDILSSRGK